MDKKLLAKILIIGIPTYTVALTTNAMVYTMPTLAITTLLATSLYKDSQEVENRIDEDGDGDGDDGDDGEDGSTLGGDG